MKRQLQQGIARASSVLSFFQFLVLMTGSVCFGVSSHGANVVAWGNNIYGQITVPPGLTNVMAIAGGGYHSTALKADGTVVTWGAFPTTITNVPPGLSNVVAVAGGNAHALALKADGKVVGWGN